MDTLCFHLTSIPAFFSLWISIAARSRRQSAEPKSLLKRTLEWRTKKNEIQGFL